MWFFEVNRSYSIQVFQRGKYFYYLCPVFSIFYKNFIICKIIFLTIATIYATWNHFFGYQTPGLILLGHNILMLIGSKNPCSMVNQLKKMTSLHSNPTTQNKRRKGQWDDPHTGKRAWSYYHPDFIYLMSIYKFYERIWKMREVISLGNHLTLKKSFIWEKRKYNLWKKRIDKKNHERKIKGLYAIDSSPTISILEQDLSSFSLGNRELWWDDRNSIPNYQKRSV